MCYNSGQHQESLRIALCKTLYLSFLHHQTCIRENTMYPILKVQYGIWM